MLHEMFNNPLIYHVYNVDNIYAIWAGLCSDLNNTERYHKAAKRETIDTYLFMILKTVLA